MSKAKTDWKMVDEDDRAHAEIRIIGAGKTVTKICMLVLQWAKSQDVMVEIRRG